FPERNHCCMFGRVPLAIVDQLTGIEWIGKHTVRAAFAERLTSHPLPLWCAQAHLVRGDSQNLRDGIRAAQELFPHSLEDGKPFRVWTDDLLAGRGAAVQIANRCAPRIPALLPFGAVA